jgi:site-specific DNA recombinase
MLSNLAYISKRRLDDGTVIDCSWPPLIDKDTCDRVQAQLATNSEHKPTGKPALNYIYLLEGLLRCGTCGSMMTRSVGNGNGGQYFHYRCTKKQRTAGAGCPVRDAAAAAVEEFVLSELRAYSLNVDAIKKRLPRRTPVVTRI